MRAPLSWIKEFAPIDRPVDEIVSALNQLGLEVEQVDVSGAEVSGVKVARVVKVMPHPDADRLVLVDLDTDQGGTRVVCGATNLVSGMMVPHAGVGAQLPGGLTLASRKIRGEVSDGMLCSSLELGFGEDARGILELDSKSTLGADVREMLLLDDVVFDLAITPNRPDAMCITGIARELAAFFDESFVIPKPRLVTESSAPDVLSVSVEDPDRCPRYYAHRAEVTVGPSPSWIRSRLLKAGMRSINNVVDVTNYVLLERNQPLHAFDAQRLDGPGVVVRRAKSGETITTLDAVERHLNSSDLLICDHSGKPQALAGILGGLGAEVTESTTEIVLEAAYFERMGIARTSKRLKVRTESSSRFERGIDPDAVASSATRALELLVEVANGRVGANCVDVYPSPRKPEKITLRTDRVNQVLGTFLKPKDIEQALTPIEIKVKKNKKLSAFDCLIPSFRPDLTREIDLVEEVARCIGFSNIGRSVPRPQSQVGGLTPEQISRRVVADALVGIGFSEAITIPFVGPEALAKLSDYSAVGLRNSLREEEPFLRPSLVSGLLESLRLNWSRGLRLVRMFEVGAVFHSPLSEGEAPIETEKIGGVLSGTIKRRPVEDNRTLDGYDAVDAIRVIARALGLGVIKVASLPAGSGLVPKGVGYEITVEGQPWGLMSALGAESGYDIPVFVFELDLSDVVLSARGTQGYEAPSPYPPTAIDLAFEIDDEVPAGLVSDTLLQASGDLVESVTLFDEYRSERLGAKRRSLAFTVQFRAPDRTLTDKEVGRWRAAGIEAVVNTLGATLRGVE